MYKMEPLSKIPRLVHGFSTRNEGNMSFLWGGEEEVKRDRNDFLESLNISPELCVAMRIQDKNVFARADASMAGKGMLEKKGFVLADGLFTNTRGLFLFLVVADCIPIILVDIKRGALGLVHAGWKSTDKKIATEAITQMKEKFKSAPEDIVVALGPAIKKESYVFNDPVQKTLPGWEDFLVALPEEGTGIDVVGYNRHQFEISGVPKENIFESKINTGTDMRFFSHYRVKHHGSSEKEGRFACVVGFE